MPQEISYGNGEISNKKERKNEFERQVCGAQWTGIADNGEFFPCVAGSSTMNFNYLSFAFSM